MESLTAMLEEYRIEKKMHHMEGSRGFENLCRLVRAIGYRDSLHQMQFRDGCVGDLMVFFEDNSGAIEALVTWIGEQDNEEWKEALESELPAKKIKDEYEDGVCPDCQQEIPDDVVEGEACSNCEHVFSYERNCDE
jgi:hypothetical protein